MAPVGHAMIDSASPAAAKPLLRGVSHEIAAGVALAAWIALVALAPSSRGLGAASVYGASLFALFAVSALYHRPTWPPRARLWLRRLDHSAIFLLIAGTYTPFCLVLGGPRGRHAPRRRLGRGDARDPPVGAVGARAEAARRGRLRAARLGDLPVMPALAARLGPGSVALLAAGGSPTASGRSCTRRGGRIRSRACSVTTRSSTPSSSSPRGSTSQSPHGQSSRCSGS